MTDLGLIKSFLTPPLWRRNSVVKVRLFPERAKQNWTLFHKTNPPCLHANLYLTQRTQNFQCKVKTENYPPPQLNERKSENGKLSTPSVATLLVPPVSGGQSAGAVIFCSN